MPPRRTFGIQAICQQSGSHRPGHQNHIKNGQPSMVGLEDETGGYLPAHQRELWWMTETAPRVTEAGPMPDDVAKFLAVARSQTGYFHG